MAGYVLAAREAGRTIPVSVGGILVGDGQFAVMAGPCAVESEEQILAAAAAVRAAGAQFLRGGAYKPRSSPYSFQGLGQEGLELLARAGAAHGLPVVTEVLDPETVGPVAEYADLVQVGSRNMQNFSLLRRVGQSGKPALLKRGLAATIEEWLLAAEYILEAGGEVILCERGIRTYESYTRNTLDLGAAVAVKNLSHLPVLVDPSHAAGRRDLVRPLGRAAMAVGADGLLVEVHPEPDKALSDGPQSLDPVEFKSLMADLARLRSALV